MTKTQEKLETFVDNTIDGFKRTLEVAKENGWKFTDLCGSLDNSTDLCYGAVLFVNIYEKKIDDETVEKLSGKLNEAKHNVLDQFLRS